MNRKEKLSYYLFGWAVKIAASAMFITCRVRVFGQKIETDYMKQYPGKGLLYASWHRGLMFFVYFYRNLKFVVMASASKDGELANQAVTRFGWVPVRGSSTRRGSEALKEMVPLISSGSRGGLVVDAPTGPAYISKIGIIVLAKRTGVPIVPVMWQANKSWRIGSWDRSIIPKPFSTIVFLYGDQMLSVPKDASKEDCERFRANLDEMLRRMMFQTDHFFKQTDYDDPRQIDVPSPAPDHETGGNGE